MKTLDEMIEKIEACSGRDLSAKTTTAIKSILRPLGFGVALSIIDELCGLDRIPINVVAAVENIVRSRRRSDYTQSPASVGVGLSAQEKPGRPDECAAFVRLLNDIIAYHYYDMAYHDHTGRLHLAPIRESGCPPGWLPVDREWYTNSVYDKALKTSETYSGDMSYVAYCNAYRHALKNYRAHKKDRGLQTGEFIPEEGSLAECLTQNVGGLL